MIICVEEMESPGCQLGDNICYFNNLLCPVHSKGGGTGRNPTHKMQACH